jgi:ribonucleoside-diphosphate reductase alpha chain
MEHIRNWSYDESRILAGERGSYYGYWDDGDRGLPWRRNLMCQVLAPTGTLARLAGCSWGIEPHYAKSMDSFILGRQFHDVNPLGDHPAFMTYEDVTGEQHVDTQASFQAYVDQAVSKTVNLPHSATHEDVAAIYLRAWEKGCKGITVLREASREDVVIKPDCKDGVCAM